MDLEKTHATKLGILFIFFVILAYILLNFEIGYLVLPVLLVSAVIWLIYEYSRGVKKKNLNAAFEIGLFLLLFDFAVENLGALFDLWQFTETMMHVITVPIEIMGLTLIGGTAWALAQPKKFNRINSAFDILLFSLFGMVGEFLLIQNGMMFYSGGWTSAHAFLGYFITWSILHYLRYRVVPIIWK
jgi:hypothetical protein